MRPQPSAARPRSGLALSSGSARLPPRSRVSPARRLRSRRRLAVPGGTRGSWSRRAPRWVRVSACRGSTPSAATGSGPTASASRPGVISAPPTVPGRRRSQSSTARSRIASPAREPCRPARVGRRTRRRGQHLRSHRRGRRRGLPVAPRTDGADPVSAAGAVGPPGIGDCNRDPLWRRPPLALTRSVAAALQRVQPDTALTFYSLSDQVNASLMQERILAALSSFFGGLALLLSSLGLYGVTSHFVSRRRTEIGIRMALGADAAQVVRMVLMRIGGLVVFGIALGTAASLWASRFVATLLYGFNRGIHCPSPPPQSSWRSSLPPPAGSRHGGRHGSTRRSCCGRASSNVGWTPVQTGCTRSSRPASAGDSVSDCRHGPEVGVDRSQVVWLHPAVIAPGHLRVVPAVQCECALVSGTNTPEPLDELRFGPGADSRLHVRRDIGAALDVSCARVELHTACERDVGYRPSTLHARVTAGAAGHVCQGTCRRRRDRSVKVVVPATLPESESSVRSGSSGIGESTGARRAARREACG